MDEFGCDYECRTVGESIMKYNIPNDWSAEFDAYDGIYPIICIQVEQIRKNPAVMELKLRIVENANEEYAGCMVLKTDMGKEEYHNSNSTTINHFYEKLFLLADRMNTAKEIAKARDRYMRDFVAQFMAEWEGIV